MIKQLLHYRISGIRRILLHIVFWAGVWFLFFYFFSYNSDDRAYVMWFSSFLLPLTIAVTYITVNRLIPEYLLVKKYFRFVLYSFYTFVIASYFVAIIIYGCLIFLLDLNINGMPPMSKNFFFILILMYLVVGIVSSVTILNHNFLTVSRNKELQNKILETQLQLKEQELNFLKSQIHPHFLFNTLNTIYGFALERSEHTPEIILKLSNLLDYILYQVSKPKVSLKEEILHIKEYIELEKIRFKDSLRINFTSDDIPENTETAPMLLIPFVENAFKHGSIVNGYLTIDIQIRLKNERLDFFLSNTYLNYNEEASGSGIGIENIRKRLDHNYGNNYFIRKEIKDNKHIVHLSVFNLKTAKL